MLLPNQLNETHSGDGTLSPVNNVQLNASEVVSERQLGHVEFKDHISIENLDAAISSFYVLRDLLSIQKSLKIGFELLVLNNSMSSDQHIWDRLMLPSDALTTVYNRIEIICDPNYGNWDDSDYISMLGLQILYPDSVDFRSKLDARFRWIGSVLESSSEALYDVDFNEDEMGYLYTKGALFPGNSIGPNTKARLLENIKRARLSMNASNTDNAKGQDLSDVVDMLTALKLNDPEGYTDVGLTQDEIDLFLRLQTGSFTRYMVEQWSRIAICTASEFKIENNRIVISHDTVAAPRTDPKQPSMPQGIQFKV